MSKTERRRTRVNSTIDRLPDDIKGRLDLKLTDTANTYEELSAWLKEEGYEISKSAIGRYAIRSTQAAQRVAETLQRTQVIAQAVATRPDLDYTKAASMVLMDGLMRRVSTAEDDFQEMPLDKAGRLIASPGPERHIRALGPAGDEAEGGAGLRPDGDRASGEGEAVSGPRRPAPGRAGKGQREGGGGWRRLTSAVSSTSWMMRATARRWQTGSKQRTLFLKYVVRTGNFPDKRAQLLKEYEAGASLTGPKGLRRMLGAFDLEYFGRAYLGHYFTTPAPAFHADLDDIWLQGVMKGMNPTEHAKEISRAKGCRRAIEAPRGHAKSTTFTFKDDLHAALYGYKHYIIILSDSSEQAEGFLTDIKDELEENAALREDFGELIGNVWKSSVAPLANGPRSRPSAQEKRSAAGGISSGGRTSSSAMTLRTTRTSPPRSSGQSSSTGTTRL